MGLLPCARARRSRRSSVQLVGLPQVRFENIRYRLNRTRRDLKSTRKRNMKLLDARGYHPRNEDLLDKSRSVVIV